MPSDGEPASPPETASAACSRVPTHEKGLDLQGEPSASAATLPAELVVMLEAFRQEGLPQEACDEIGALCSQARARGSNRRDRRRDPLPPRLNQARAHSHRSSTELVPTPLVQILARTRTVTKHRFLELVSDAVGDDAELLRRGLASARKQLQAQGWRPRSSPSS